MVFVVFTGTCGTLLGAVSPTPFSVPLILLVCWNCAWPAGCRSARQFAVLGRSQVFNILSWALVSYNMIPLPFHYLFSWLLPLRWFFGSIMGSLIFPLAVKCAENELTRFDVPASALV